MTSGNNYDYVNKQVNLQFSDITTISDNYYKCYEYANVKSLLHFLNAVCHLSQTPGILLSPHIIIHLLTCSEISL